MYMKMGSTTLNALEQKYSNCDILYSKKIKDTIFLLGKLCYLTVSVSLFSKKFYSSCYKQSVLLTCLYLIVYRQLCH